jgi:hypothetical protein
MADLRTGVVGPMAWHLGVGLALIGASLALPWWSAERTARAEMRASQIVDCLLEVGQQLGRDGPPDADVAAARLYALGAARGAFLADLQAAADADGAWLTMSNKHYAFRLAPIAVDPAARAAPDAATGIEALAWPLAAAGPGHAMFYAPEDGSRAYTRNLAHGHFGFDARRPGPETGRRRNASMFDTRLAYRSRSDERWILH